MEILKKVALQLGMDADRAVQIADPDFSDKSKPRKIKEKMSRSQVTRRSRERRLGKEPPVHTKGVTKRLYFRATNGKTSSIVVSSVLATRLVSTGKYQEKR